MLWRPTGGLERHSFCSTCFLYDSCLTCITVGAPGARPPAFSVFLIQSDVKIGRSVIDVPHKVEGLLALAAEKKCKPWINERSLTCVPSRASRSSTDIVLQKKSGITPSSESGTILRKYIPDTDMHRASSATLLPQLKLKHTHARILASP